MGKTTAALVALTLTLLPASRARSTAQKPDHLLIDGKPAFIFTNPLQQHPQQQAIRSKLAFRSMSTACWRGYVASWEIRKKTLYLVEIRSCNGKQRGDLKRIFGKRYKSGRVKADWYSGELRVPQGKRLRYVHMGYSSVYERELMVRIDKGRVTGRRLIDNRPHPPKKKTGK